MFKKRPIALLYAAPSINIKRDDEHDEPENPAAQDEPAAPAGENDKPSYPANYAVVNNGIRGKRGAARPQENISAVYAGPPIAGKGFREAEILEVYAAPEFFERKTAERLCTECGTAVGKADNFCFNCGAKLPEYKRDAPKDI